jgi:hypothetical protein
LPFESLRFAGWGPGVHPLNCGACLSTYDPLGPTLLRLHKALTNTFGTTA